MASEHEGEPADKVEATSRRAWLRWAAAGAGAAVVGTVVATPTADAAGPGTAVDVGSVGNFSTLQTGIVHNGTTQNGPALNAYRTAGTTTGVQYSENAAIVAESTIADSDAIVGFGPSGPMASGVHGFAFNGRAVLGTGDQGVGVRGEIRSGNNSPNSVAVQADNQSTGAGSIGVDASATQSTGGLGGRFAGSLAPLLLVPATTTGAPATGPHAAGELFVDAAGDLYYCRAAGSPGTWVNVLAAPAPSTAPALHPVSPARVYDSREPQPHPGPLATGQVRTVSVANGRAIQGGAVTVPDLVPAGAAAIAYNFTITGTVGSGFLTLNPGGLTEVTSSAINWSASGQILTTGGLVAISASREVTVIAGGPGSTDFLLDVVGYYR